MLFAMGARDQLVGVTEFCNYPPEAPKKPKIGYANPNLESLVALQPDLVVAPNEFLKPDVIVKFDQLKIPVFILADENVEISSSTSKRSGASSIDRRLPMPWPCSFGEQVAEIARDSRAIARRVCSMC